MLRSLLALVLVILSGCASSPPGGAVLEPVEETQPKDEATQRVETPESEALKRVRELFATLGYEGVGLEFEKDSTLELLHHIFSDPRTAKRRVKLVYTGHAMAYDPKAESLTVGGVSDPAPALAFIVKYVPSKK